MHRCKQAAAAQTPPGGGFPSHLSDNFNLTTTPYVLKFLYALPWYVLMLEAEGLTTQNRQVSIQTSIRYWPYCHVTKKERPEEDALFHHTYDRSQTLDLIESLMPVRFISVSCHIKSVVLNLFSSKYSMKTTWIQNYYQQYESFFHLRAAKCSLLSFEYRRCWNFSAFQGETNKTYILINLHPFAFSNPSFGLHKHLPFIIPWKRASQLCKQTGGHLPYFTSGNDLEQLLVMFKLVRNFEEMEGIFIGLKMTQKQVHMSKCPFHLFLTICMQFAHRKNEAQNDTTADTKAANILGKKCFPFHL